MRKAKRKLTEKEVQQIRDWMIGASQGRKPSIRTIAKRYGVNKPSVIKSLGGWKGIQRDKPESPEKTKFGKMLDEKGYPLELEGYTTEVNIDHDKAKKR